MIGLCRWPDYTVLKVCAVVKSDDAGRLVGTNCSLICRPGYPEPLLTGDYRGVHRKSTQTFQENLAQNTFRGGLELAFDEYGQEGRVNPGNTPLYYTGTFKGVTRGILAPQYWDTGATRGGSPGGRGGGASPQKIPGSF